MINEFLLINCDVDHPVFFDGVAVEQRAVTYTERRILKLGRSLLIFIGPLYQHPPESTTAEKKNKLQLADLEKMAKAKMTQKTESIKLKKGEILKKPIKAVAENTFFTIAFDDKSRHSTGEPLLIGSNELCDLILPESSGAAAFHAMVYINEQGLFIEPIGKARLKVDDIEITVPAMLVNPNTNVKIVASDSAKPGSELTVSHQENFAALCENARIRTKRFRNFKFNAIADSAADSFTIDRYSDPR